MATEIQYTIGGSSPQTLDNPPVAGNTIVLAVSQESAGAGTSYTVSDSVNAGAYTAEVTYLAASSRFVGIYSKRNIAGSNPTITVAPVGGSSTFTWFAAEVSGLDYSAAPPTGSNTEGGTLHHGSATGLSGTGYGICVAAAQFVETGVWTAGGSWVKVYGDGLAIYFQTLIGVLTNDAGPFDGSGTNTVDAAMAIFLDTQARSSAFRSHLRPGPFKPGIAR